MLLCPASCGNDDDDDCGKDFNEKDKVGDDDFEDDEDLSKDDAAPSQLWLQRLNLSSCISFLHQRVTPSSWLWWWWSSILMITVMIKVKIIKNKKNKDKVACLIQIFEMGLNHICHHDCHHQPEQFYHHHHEWSSSSSLLQWASCEDRLADLCSSRHLQNHQHRTDMRFMQKICQRFVQRFQTAHVLKLKETTRNFKSHSLTERYGKCAFSLQNLQLHQATYANNISHVCREPWLDQYLNWISPQYFSTVFLNYINLFICISLCISHVCRLPWLAQFEEKITGIGSIWGELTAATVVPDHEKCVKRHLLQSSSY